MTYPQLQEYVRLELARGVQRTALYTALLQAGWKRDVVEEAVYGIPSELSAPDPTASPAPTAIAPRVRISSQPATVPPAVSQPLTLLDTAPAALQAAELHLLPSNRDFRFSRLFFSKGFLLLLFAVSVAQTGIILAMLGSGSGSLPTFVTELPFIPKTLPLPFPTTTPSPGNTPTPNSSSSPGTSTPAATPPPAANPTLLGTVTLSEGVISTIPDTEFVIGLKSGGENQAVVFVGPDQNNKCPSREVTLSPSGLYTCGNTTYTLKLAPVTIGGTTLPAVEVYK